MKVPACPTPSRKKTGRLLKLTDSAQLPNVSMMDGSPSFSTVHIGWNSKGLGIRVIVCGRTRPLAGEPNHPTDSDCVELWIDTRPTGNVHRATGYCHRLACFPCNLSADGEPTVVPMSIPQQREVKSDIQIRHIQLRVHARKDGYEMEVWIPESQLYGYREIDELRQLGFYCLVHDTELGEQPLTVTEEFPVAWDPSLWVQLELADK